MWKPKFLRPHAWYCETCKKFEITKNSRSPSWVGRYTYTRYFAHYTWESNMINNQDFGRRVFCGEIKKVLAKFEGI